MRFRSLWGAQLKSLGFPQHSCSLFGCNSQTGNCSAHSPVSRMTCRHCPKPEAEHEQFQSLTHHTVPARCVGGEVLTMHYRSKASELGRDSAHFRHGSGSVGTFLLLGVGDSTLDRTVRGKCLPTELHPQPFQSYFKAARSFQDLAA